jgi:hypothetical protein
MEKAVVDNIPIAAAASAILFIATSLMFDLSQDSISRQLVAATKSKPMAALAPR